MGRKAEFVERVSLSPEDEERIVQDAAVIGKPMMDAIYKLAKERGEPLSMFFQPAYAAFQEIAKICLEDGKLPSLKSELKT